MGISRGSKSQILFNYPHQHYWYYYPNGRLGADGAMELLYYTPWWLQIQASGTYDTFSYSAFVTDALCDLP